MNRTFRVWSTAVQFLLYRSFAAEIVISVTINKGAIRILNGKDLLYLRHISDCYEKKYELDACGTHTYTLRAGQGLSFTRLPAEKELFIP
jgi:hypothetical protein